MLTLSCPPQGKLPSLFSSKPRALGEMSWKWQEANKGTSARKMRARKQLNLVMFGFFFSRFFLLGGKEGGKLGL